MLTKAQIIFIKRAQREAALSDEDYRDAIAAVSGMADCRSSKDRRLTDEHFDSLLAYFEAIYWREHSKPGKAIFKEFEYWKNRNPRGNTSRDRFVEKELQTQVFELEGRLAGLGYGPKYCQAIQNRIQPFSLITYAAALRRTFGAKERKENVPF